MLLLELCIPVMEVLVLGITVIEEAVRLMLSMLIPTCFVLSQGAPLTQ